MLPSSCLIVSCLRASECLLLEWKTDEGCSAFFRRPWRPQGSHSFVVDERAAGDGADVMIFVRRLSSCTPARTPPKNVRFLALSSSAVNVVADSRPSRRAVNMIQSVFLLPSLPLTSHMLTKSSPLYPPCSEKSVVAKYASETIIGTLKA